MSAGTPRNALTLHGLRRRRDLRRRSRELDRLSARLSAAESTRRASAPASPGHVSSEAVSSAPGTSALVAAGTASRTGARQRRRTPWWRIGIRALLVLLVGAGLLHVRQLSHNPADSLRISLPGAFSNPPLPSDAAEDRLLPPVAGPSGDGGYRFSTTQPFGSAPVTYNPCRPIHVVVSYEKAPPNAQESVRAALAAMQASTGLYFILDGETTELATVARPPVDVARYGDRWAPVLIAFTTPARIPRLSGNVAGLGGSTPQSSGGHRTYVTGIVYLDGPDLFDSIGSRWGYAEMQAIIMHELGHVVGLEHTPDNGELMNAANSGQLQFGAGDLRGLARLGQGSCERSF